jgi:hypothetical protein
MAEAFQKEDKGVNKQPKRDSYSIKIHFPIFHF